MAGGLFYAHTRVIFVQTPTDTYSGRFTPMAMRIFGTRIRANGGDRRETCLRARRYRRRPNTRLRAVNRMTYGGAAWLNSRRLRLSHSSAGSYAKPLPRYRCKKKKSNGTGGVTWPPTGTTTPGGVVEETITAHRFVFRPTWTVTTRVWGKTARRSVAPCRHYSEGPAELCHDRVSHVS